MAQRITIKDLHAVASRINSITGSPAVAWVKPERSDRYIASIGNYHIDGAYGGYALHRMTNEGGGVSDVLGRGHVPTRELYELMQAWIKGFNAGREFAAQKGA